MNTRTTYSSTLSIVLLAGLLIGATSAQAQDSDYGTGVSVEVPQVDASVMTMDGQADEAAWEDAPTFNMTENWSGSWSGHPDPDVQATARALWSEDTLYIYAEIQDYQEFFWGQPGDPWQGEQILIGVDGTHSMDDQTDDTFAGWPSQAPDSLTVYKVTREASGGITSNWGYDGVFPADSGWVNGTVPVDSSSFIWGVETAIYVPQIEEGAQIGFNIGGASASEERFADTDSSDGAYAYFAWSATEDAGLAVQNSSKNYATLQMEQSVGIIEEPGPQAEGVALKANYPNPFQRSTTFAYALDRPAHVELAVYDVLGRRVETLVSGRRDARLHRVRWTPGDLPSGLYVTQLRVDGKVVATQRMTLMR